MRSFHRSFGPGGVMVWCSHNIEAQQDMQNASSKMTEAMSRLSRLEKQQALLREKASELIRRRVAFLKELEEQERFEEE
ncbi:hypothetical protein DL767_008292 [Monosporascus sp. MG133]|nr:hypothetical protein DL767_008292 [Monosporascus sp. MG133]